MFIKWTEIHLSYEACNLTVAVLILYTAVVVRFWMLRSGKPVQNCKYEDRIRLIELRFCVSLVQLGTKQVILETLLPANLLVKQNLA